jgi:hypothetical protein
MSEVVGREMERAEGKAARRPWRPIVIEALGPLTALAGVVWAIAQPYRITFVHPDGKGFYDYLAQPPLLVVLVGLIFSLTISRGLLKDINGGDGSTR